MEQPILTWRVHWLYLRNPNLAPYFTLFGRGYLRIAW